MAHSLLSPSGAHRWLNCAGSVMLESGFPDDGSAYAAEGTLAHDIAAECLEDEVDPQALLGKRYDVDGFVMTVTQDMVDHVKDYMSLVREYAQGGVLLIERRVDLSDVVGVEDTGGTADAIILKGNALTVIDLKYGMGVAVSAENNPQLMLYALGALHDYGDLADFEEVCMVIHQPRLNAVSEFWSTVENLNAFAAIVREQAEGIMAGDDTLNPGPSQCRFCKAKAVCPALTQEVSTAVEPVGAAATLDEMKVFLQDQTADVIGTAMDRVDLVEMWCGAVRGEAMRRLQEGLEVPGYKLVEGRKGNRQWADEAAVEEALKSYRFKKEEMYDFKLISPTKAEKLLSDNPRRWSKLEKLVTRNDGKPSVAPVTDKRPALVVNNVAAELMAFAQEDSGTTAN